MVIKSKGSTLKVLKTRPYEDNSPILSWAFVSKTSDEFLQSELLETYLDD